MVKIKVFGVGINSTGKKELMSRTKMPHSTLHEEDLDPTEAAEIQVWILEGGRVLAALVGKDFLVVGDLWTEVNQFHRVIDGNELKNTWVTMITPDERR